MSHTYSSKIAIIGAGMAGLMAATEARAMGLETLLVDKGRGVGGRMATRRIGDAVFDHGAQFFTVRDPHFAKYVEDWRQSGEARIWSYGFGEEDGHPRYMGARGMTSIPKTPARNCCILPGRRVLACAFDKLWTLHLEDGDSIGAEALILTAPVPQSLSMLEAGRVDLPRQALQALSALEYHRSLALMALFDSTSKLEPPGALRLQGESVVWIADNHRKGISLEAGALSIHSSARFAEEQWEQPAEQTMRRMLQPVRRFCRGQLTEWQLHRWRYAEPINPYPERCLVTTAPGLAVFAGDAFGGPKVEGAALSGMAAARAIAHHLKPAE